MQIRAAKGCCIKTLLLLPDAADAALKSENLSFSFPLRNDCLSNDVCLSESSIL